MASFFAIFNRAEIHLVARDIFRQIDLQPGKALGLHAQQHDHIGSAQRIFDVTGHAHAGREGRSRFPAPVPADRRE